MALNIFPRRTSDTSSAPPAIENEPVATTTDSGPSESDAAPATRRRSSRSRGGSRGRSTTTTETSESSASPNGRTATRRSTSREDSAEDEEEQKTTSSRRRSRSTAKKDDEGDVRDEPKESSRTSSRRRSTARKDDAERPAARKDDGDGRLPAELLKTIENQAKQIEELTKLQREMSQRIDSLPIGPVARVGVFVDVANVELATDKLPRRLDWSKVLTKLTRDRQLVRAVAYSPVHEDLNVSLESQRFTEPFVDRGYRIVPKPLKKFSDGTVKANVDIEMTLDIMSMLDRLDVLCLVSGDGDFEPLVKVVQERGIRVEVVSVGNATAMALKRSADRFIDLANILNEVGK